MFNPFPKYAPRPAFVEPVPQLAFLTHGLPMTSYLGGTGQLVKGTLNAENPAGYIPSNSQVIVSPYGRATQPNYLPVLQSLTLPEQPDYGSF